jgi:hypothetical protein
MNFDPLDYMNSADAANIQLQNAFDESKFRDFTNLVMVDMENTRREGKAHQLTKRLKTSPSKFGFLTQPQKSDPNAFRGNFAGARKGNPNPLDVSIAISQSHS